MRLQTRSPQLRLPVPTGVSKVHRRHRWTIWIVCTLVFLEGVLLVLLSYREAQTSTTNFHFNVFWIGIASLVFSTLVLGTREWMSTTGRTVVLVAYGAALFIPKFFMSVSGPVYFDEYGQWRQANDLVRTGVVFAPNPYQPILRYFPGLSVMTVAVHELTRLSTWYSGQLLVLVAHCSVLVTMFWIAETVGLSRRTSFLVAMVYSVNPGYLYFDTQYAYESLALPLAFFTILTVLEVLTSTRRKQAVWWTIAGCASACLCFTTHHISSIFMGAICLALTFRLRPRPQVDPSRADALGWEPSMDGFSKRCAWVITLFAFGGTILWLVAVAPSTFGYIGPNITTGIQGLIHLVAPTAQKVGAKAGTHKLFSGSKAPTYEIAAGFVSPLAIVVVFLLVVRQYAWFPAGDLRRTAPVVGLLGREPSVEPARHRLLLLSFGVTGVYLASLLMAFTAGGGQGAHRSWSFTYLGVAVTAGYFFEHVLRPREWRPPFRPSTLGIIGILLFGLLMGNVAAGQNIDYRFPGPYRFGSDTRSGSPELNALVVWLDAHAPPGSAVITDRFTQERITGYSDLVVPSPDQSQAFAIYGQGNQYPVDNPRFVADNPFRYFVLDKRILTMTPEDPFFQGAQGLGAISRSALTALPGSNLQLVYESPNYEVFRIEPPPAGTAHHRAP